jgi:Superinfection exclusion gene product 17
MNKLKVSWIPQLGMKGDPFIVYVETLLEAKILLDTLAFYDLYQFNNNIKGDYANVGGLDYWDEEEQDWCIWWIPEAVLEFLDDYSLKIIDDLTVEQIRELSTKGLI